ncbi:hypothetical protein, partial [Spirosoma daeguense]
YKFKRRTIGNMVAVTKLLSRFTIGTISGNVLTQIGTIMAGSKIVLILPILMGLVSFASLVITDLLFWIVSVSEIEEEPPYKATIVQNPYEAHEQA